MSLAPSDDVGPAATGPHPIAVEVRGTLSSGDAGASGRLLVIASPYFLTNPFARPLAGGDRGRNESLAAIAGPYAKQMLTPSVLAFKNQLDWLTHDPGVLACVDRALPAPPPPSGEQTTMR